MAWAAVQGRTAGVSRRVAPGFSLLEIMFALLIIGVLMGVAAMSLSGSSERAKIRATKMTLSTVKSALDTYQTEYNAFPPSLQTLATLRPPILEAGKLKDGWQQDLVYIVPGAAERPYDLISKGGDTRGGTDDDINVWSMGN